MRRSPIRRRSFVDSEADVEQDAEVAASPRELAIPPGPLGPAAPPPCLKLLRAAALSLLGATLVLLLCLLEPWSSEVSSWHDTAPALTLATPADAAFLESTGEESRRLVLEPPEPPAHLSEPEELLESARRGDPVPPLSQPNGSTPIVVEISSFLDGVRCAWTLRRALERAHFPHRIHFSLLQARGPDDTDCIDYFRHQHLPELCRPGQLGALQAPPAGSAGTAPGGCEAQVLSRVKAWLISPEAGQGPAHQRGVAGELLEFETPDSLCMSIDSHMDFNADWDTALIRDWLSTGNEFAVLTTYPGGVDTKLDKPCANMVELCGFEMEGKIPRGRRAVDVRPPKPDEPPLMTMNWAAGFSFHRCHMEEAVPVDWLLRWIFTGEEINRAVRLFTHGYDMYLPKSVAVVHNYSDARQEFKKFGDTSGAMAAASKRRLLSLLQVKDAGVDFGKFGLGAQRSLEDYVRWSRVNLGGKWTRLLQDPAGVVQETAPHECSWLDRQPVRDPRALVAGVRARPAARAWRATAAGHVEIDGEQDVVRPLRRVLS